MDIDFVVCTVDGNDTQWQTEYRKYTPSETGGINAAVCRYRDWALLRYWFRSVEVNAPWVYAIWLVVASESQVPEWIDRNNPKLRIVYHEDYIPKEFLPTFNSHTIELNLHRINGLSEHFVYFNDDMFINAPVTPEYYFRKGLPCDATNEQPLANPIYSDEDHWGIRMINFNNVAVLNRHFSRVQAVKKNRWGWYGVYLSPRFFLGAFMASTRSFFSGFTTPHVEKPLLKSVFQEIWDAEPDWMRRSCSRFRQDDNVSVYLIRMWQLASNRFHACRYKGKARIDIQMSSIEQIRKAINNKKITSLCLNDTEKAVDGDFEYLRSEIISMFENKYPDKCSFEK